LPCSRRRCVSPLHKRQTLHCRDPADSSDRFYLDDAHARTGFVKHIASRWRHLRRSEKGSDGDSEGDTSVDFEDVVPALPGPLISSFVLSQFNWGGARSDNEAADAPKQGRSWAFVRRYKAQVGQIILVAFVWSCSIFVAPLSMNLLLSYIQDKASTPCSPYVFVVGLLAGPVIASLTLQNRCEVSMGSR